MNNILIAENPLLVIKLLLGELFSFCIFGLEEFSIILFRDLKRLVFSTLYSIRLPRKHAKNLLNA